MATKLLPSSTFVLSYPSPSILLVTINRANTMNSIPLNAHWEGESIFQWFDDDPSLRVAIITGSGTKAFCAGQDLLEQQALDTKPTHPSIRKFAPGGFGGLSRRRGKKPVIAAVNGYALGGGFEMCLNCDMVIASPTAKFGLPEPSVGVYAASGGLARVIRNCGLQIGSEIALTGRQLSAREAKEFHLVNRISQSPETLINETIEVAKLIVALSPDSIIVTRHGLREAWETASVERATQLTEERYDECLLAAPNRAIGLRAFAAKEKPNWVQSKI